MKYGRPTTPACATIRFQIQRYRLLLKLGPMVFKHCLTPLINGGSQKCVHGPARPSLQWYLSSSDFNSRIAEPNGFALSTLRDRRQRINMADQVLLEETLLACKVSSSPDQWR